MLILADFKYTAVTKDGGKLSGVISANDKTMAMKKVRAENPGCTVQSVAPQGFDWNVQLTTPKIQDKSIAFACSQFKILLKAGLPMVRTIQVIAEQSVDKVLSDVFNQVALEVAEGAKFCDSLEKTDVILPTVFIETLRAGEESGTMDDSFAKMEIFFTKSYKLRAKVKAALSYPMIMVVVAVVVVNVIIIFALPNFLPMFEEDGLPGPTQLLLDYYNFTMSYWYIGVGILGVAYFMFQQWVSTESGSSAWAVFSMKAPIFGAINQMNAASQFANTLSTLLTSGLSVVKALEITGKVVTNRSVGDSIKFAIKDVEEGATIGSALKKHTMLPKLLLEMIEIGEAAGSLEETLETIGRYYDEETEVVVEGALNKIEPLMTCVMGVVIGFIMIALYLPIFNMSV